MLRIAGRRLSSLSWRSNQTAAPASVSSYRNLIGGGGDSKMTSDESKSDITNFTSRSAFLYSTRGFASDSITQQISNIGMEEHTPATLAALKNPTNKIVYDNYNHERYPPGDPSKRAFAYFVLTGGRFVYASLIRLLVLKFVLSMSASKDVLALASLEVDLTSIEPGSTVTVKWRGKPVFIRRRTEDDIKLANSVDQLTLRDPEEDAVRVKNPEWLIVVGVCTHLGCIPLPNAGDYGGWFCPCHGSHYDISGRIRKGPAPKNLEVPTYSFLEDNKLLIG
ncbi:cytochrome b-c1 complex subunit Rieske-4, mitochondrial-like [Papaver somniferum]|uniref:cytochrome b-c1 complex subunit Rieske-4, mitochondrial-like n=1 Tax=Papaver somniferum TaxID=3469 RepID=UPI000E6F541F|nr:cytochrome b-c1 complex subunit Rieske-4, mitochondrial-like [Papaver somniferum]